MKKYEGWKVCCSRCSSVGEVVYTSRSAAEEKAKKVSKFGSDSTTEIFGKCACCIKYPN